MDGTAFPVQTARLFLAVRRGIPMAVGGASLGLAAFEPAGRGWYLLLAMACLAEVWPTFRKGSDYLRSRSHTIRRDGLWVRAFRPLARWLGREEAWILSFCAWNNHRVKQCFETTRARKALVLLPHCIQASHCKAEIIADLGNCFSCGRCSVGDVLQQLLTNRWDCRISNRSHKAYREAREFQPDLIVAVSCSDRLFKGLTKLAEVPSYVIPLQLPHGMCVDTTFSVPHLAAAMEALVEPRPERDTRILPLQIEPGA